MDFVTQAPISRHGKKPSTVIAIFLKHKDRHILSECLGVLSIGNEATSAMVEQNHFAPSLPHIVLLIRFFPLSISCNPKLLPSKRISKDFDSMKKNFHPAIKMIQKLKNQKQMQSLTSQKLRNYRLNTLRTSFTAANGRPGSPVK